MNIKRILSLTLVAVLVLAMAMSGCGGNETSSSTAGTSSAASEPAGSETSTASTNEGGETLAAEQVITLQQPNVATFDSAQTTDAESGTFLAETMEGLFRYRYEEDGSSVFEPAGIESYEISDDGLTYTFHLNDNMWSDGQPVTANDYVYAVKRLLNADLACGYAFFAYGIVNAREYEADNAGFDFDQVGVKAIDDKTVEYTLSEPDAQFLFKVGFTCFNPLREDIVEPLGDTYGDDWTQLVYNGPFICTDWTSESEGTLVKNENYWDADSVKLQQINLVYVDEDATRDKLFKEGELYQLGGAGDYLEEYKTMAENGECQYIHRDYSAAAFYNVFNKKTGGISGLMNNAKICAAIGYAIDNVEYCETIYGRYTPANSYVPADAMLGDQSYRERTGNEELWKADREKYTGNPEALQELFKEGLTELGLQTDDLSQYTVTYICYGDSSRALQIQEYIKQAVESNLGINLELNVCSGWAQFLTDTKDYTLWDFYQTGWVADYNEPMTYMENWASTQSDMWENEEYDALIDEARVTLDEAKRAELYQKAEQMLYDNQVIMPTYFSDVNTFILNSLRGLQIGSIGFGWDAKYAYVVEE